MQKDMDSRFLDLSPLLSGETERIGFDRSFPWDPDENGIRSSALGFSGSVSLSAGEWLLEGVAACTLTSVCARCLAPVSRAFSVPVKTWVLKENDEERDAVVMENEAIDLFSVAEEAVLLELPLRLLCREDCKGLCPKCGKDLNAGECACEKKEIDPRLAKLADYFK